MVSSTSTRLWRACNAAGRPWPVLDEDDVIDYMVMEAVAAKVAKADEEQRKVSERTKWKKNTGNLEQFR